MPRSAIIWTRSRELSLKARYHLTHRIMISWSKCRPLNRSCAEVGSVIPAVIAGYRAFQQFAPEPFRVGVEPPKEIEALVSFLFVAMKGKMSSYAVRSESSASDRAQIPRMNLGV